MITPIPGNATAATSATVASDAPQADAVLSSDFETFIKMLTTQAKYQDPMEPIDNSEYAAQLAQFSMVEQQVQSNDLLKALATQLGSGGIGQLAGWIGMEARTTGPVPFDGSPITVLPTPPANATAMELVVFDAQGREVDRNPLPVSDDPVLWAGVQQSGKPFAAGQYSFSVEGEAADGSTLPSKAAATYARITEVQTNGTDPQVVFNGGAQVSASSITALREGA
ncbi:flagellar hook capping FlgD N-terminal domain-containing protein [uncultured Sulfitobacter sp.]|uniref:flagellar hook capping FlgD N-terminal domain-containing protein n=1 Tax=uncultured Sulfitobacter sp. TaxID=191468 RepID=UPI00262CB44F|nr:flagellar hook capping FlgD N-terminal domain-containing protein [uncultured Sulfitobacter sp.]